MNWQTMFNVLMFMLHYTKYGWIRKILQEDSKSIITGTGWFD